MEYRELKRRAEMLKKSGFRREMLIKSYVKTIHSGDDHHRRYISYYEIKTYTHFDSFINYVIERMENELNYFIKNKGG